jgi:hypothetical protein
MAAPLTIQCVLAWELSVWVWDCARKKQNPPRFDCTQIALRPLEESGGARFRCTPERLIKIFDSFCWVTHFVACPTREPKSEEFQRQLEEDGSNWVRIGARLGSESDHNAAKKGQATYKPSQRLHCVPNQSESIKRESGAGGRCTRRSLSWRAEGPDLAARPEPTASRP